MEVRPLVTGDACTLPTPSRLTDGLTEDEAAKRVERSHVRLSQEHPRPPHRRVALNLEMLTMLTKAENAELRSTALAMSLTPRCKMSLVVIGKDGLIADATSLAHSQALRFGRSA